MYLDEDIAINKVRIASEGYCRGVTRIGVDVDVNRLTALYWAVQRGVTRDGPKQEFSYAIMLNSIEF